VGGEQVYCGMNNYEMLCCYIPPIALNINDHSSLEI